MGDFTDAGSDAFVNDEQIVVGVEREFVGIERAFGLGGVCASIARRRRLGR